MTEVTSQRASHKSVQPSTRIQTIQGGYRAQHPNIKEICYIFLFRD